MDKTTIKRITLVLGQLFNGLIDEVALYDRALMETEIKDHYHAFANKGMIYFLGAVKPAG